MSIAILPKTVYGKWSVGLILNFFVFLGVFFLLVSFGERGGDTFFSNLLLTIPMLVVAFSGISSFFVGVFSFFKKERSVFVLVSVLFGLFVLWYCVVELVFPH